MKIKCIAIDDEPLALDIIVQYCSQVPFLELVQTFSNSVDCIDYLTKNKVDLMFLDIQMDRLTGIQLLNVLKQKPLTIFTTAYDSYAIKGYELDIVDYLLKPISFERFVKAADKAFDILQGKEVKVCVPDEMVQAGENGNNFMFVKTEYRFEKVFFSDILYIEGMGDYLRIVTTDKKIMTLQNFKALEELLPASKFFRVHKSFMVAVDKIESVERNRIKMAGQIIPISETYKKNFTAFFDARKLE